MFDNLSERLERSFKILKGEGKITEINVAETLKDVRKAPLFLQLQAVLEGLAHALRDPVIAVGIGVKGNGVHPGDIHLAVRHDPLHHGAPGGVHHVHAAVLVIRCDHQNRLPRQ